MAQITLGGFVECIALCDFLGQIVPLMSKSVAEESCGSRELERLGKINHGG